MRGRPDRRLRGVGAGRRLERGVAQRCVELWCGVRANAPSGASARCAAPSRPHKLPFRAGCFVLASVHSGNGNGNGTTTLGANLTLIIPVTQQAGPYVGSLTISAVATSP